MNLLLQREPPDGDCIKGELFIEGEYFCLTLERPAVAIPPGNYDVEMRRSPHFGVVLPHICNVPGREDILIHWGNYPRDTLGCVLVGFVDGDHMIGRSRDALAALVAKITLEDRVTITVANP